MPDRHHALTPEALAMVDSIARTGSFAAAARALGKVPSALTYSVRQLEESLDVLLFDRRSRSTQLTAAGQELLIEARRILIELETVANRVRRVATGWETQLTVAVDAIIAPSAIFDLIDAFYRIAVPPFPPESHRLTPASPPTRLRLRSEVLSGTFETLAQGESDLTIGVLPSEALRAPAIQSEQLGRMPLVFVTAPHHPLAQMHAPLSPRDLAQHRVVAIADSAQHFTPATFGIQPGQDVLTVASMSAKLEALLRGLGTGALPESLARRHIQAGHLIEHDLEQPRPDAELHYAWRTHTQQGLALQWWLQQLRNATTRRALLEQHVGLVL